MIKFFTQNSIMTDWSEDLNDAFQYEGASLDLTMGVSPFAPSEESVSFLRNFARSFMVDLSADAESSFPMA